MKKIIATGLVCALAISAAGCGEQVNETGVVMEPITTENGEAGTATETAPAQTETQTTAETTDNQTEAASGNLYEALKQGTGTIKYRKTNGRAGYLETYNVLEDGKSYTVDEIIKACETASGFYNEDGNPNVTYRDIDCGQDGVPELLVNIEFGASVNLTMIVKEIDNELVVCFDQDGGERYYVEVSDNGVIEASGSSAANVHSVDYSYVDGNGDYHFYYGVEETLTLYDEFYAYTSGLDYVTIPVEGLDADHIGIRDYYFEADYEKRNHMFNYFTLNDNYEDVTTDADYDDSNLLKQRFKEAGITTYTAAEMEQKLKDRAAEIGYPGK